jgi:hypothetical protein
MLETCNLNFRNFLKLKICMLNGHLASYCIINASCARTEHLNFNKSTDKVQFPFRTDVLYMCFMFQEELF